MTGIGAGLAAFGVGSGIGSFIDGVGKLFGGQSPIDKILSLADRAEAIEGIGPAFEKAAAGINSFGSKIRFFDGESSGVQSFLDFLSNISGVGMARDKLPAIRALSGLMRNFGEVNQPQVSKAVDNSQGAAMAAIQNDTLERIAAAAEAQLAIISGGSNNTTNNVNQTQVNQSNIPDRDLTTSMYGVNSAM
jgi:hypothetical protein